MAKLRLMLSVLVLLYAVYYWKIISSRCRYKGNVQLHGRTAIITGGNSGIGRETALDLARRGARVILACRNLQKAEEAAKEIRSRTGNSEVVSRHLELASLKSVRDFARRINDEEKRLDILINNAGTGSSPDESVTEENFHLDFGINHFGHFLLTNLLLDLLRKSAPSRVVTVSSGAHFMTNKAETDLTRVDPEGKSTVLYPRLKGYSISKLANILFASELARREKSAGIVSVSLHPGVIYTPIMYKFMSLSPMWSKIYYPLSPLFWPLSPIDPDKLFCLDEEAGAQTTIHCALDESVAQFSGSYFDNCALAEPSALAQDDQFAKRLWRVSCEATGLKC